MSLLIDWCSAKAATYACKNWHYSASVPAFKKVCFGAWEDEKFIGAVIFGNGSSRNIGRQFKVQRHEAVELLRVALTEHKAPVSKIISICLRLLKIKFPALRFVVSFADTGQGHSGGIYQAGNWVFTGTGGQGRVLRVGGRIRRSRSVGLKYGTHSIDWLRKHIDPKAKIIKTAVKFKYVYPLDKEAKVLLSNISKPYPKRLKHSIDAVAHQAAEGGVIPTEALQ